MIQLDQRNSGQQASGGESNQGVILVGGGRFAHAVARTMPEKICAVVLRDTSKGASLEAILPGVAVIASLEAIDPSAYDTLWIATADGSLHDVAEFLVEARPCWRGCTVLHSSGATSPHVLDAFARRGATILALHPNASFTGDSPMLPGLVWGVSEGEGAIDAAHRLIGHLAPTLVVVPEKFRALYHAAASVAANYSVTLFAMAHDLYQRAGFSEEEARAVVAQFIRSSADRAALTGPAAALTGPIARGDAQVVTLQSDAIRHMAPEYLAAFLELAQVTGRLAGRGPRGEPEEGLKG